MTDYHKKTHYYKTEKVISDDVTKKVASVWGRFHYNAFEEFYEIVSLKDNSRLATGYTMGEAWLNYFNAAGLTVYCGRPGN